MTIKTEKKERKISVSMMIGIAMLILSRFSGTKTYWMEGIKKEIEMTEPIKDKKLKWFRGKIIDYLKETEGEMSLEQAAIYAVQDVYKVLHKQNKKKDVFGRKDVKETYKAFISTFKDEIEAWEAEQDTINEFDDLTVLSYDVDEYTLNPKTGSWGSPKGRWSKAHKKYVYDFIKNKHLIETYTKRVNRDLPTKWFFIESGRDPNGYEQTEMNQTLFTETCIRGQGGKLYRLEPRVKDELPWQTKAETFKDNTKAAWKQAAKLSRVMQKANIDYKKTAELIHGRHKLKLKSKQQIENFSIAMDELNELDGRSIYDAYLDVKQMFKNKDKFKVAELHKEMGWTDRFNYKATYFVIMYGKQYKGSRIFRSIINNFCKYKLKRRDIERAIDMIEPYALRLAKIVKEMWDEEPDLVYNNQVDNNPYYVPRTKASEALEMEAEEAYAMLYENGFEDADDYFDAKWYEEGESGLPSEFTAKPLYGDCQERLDDRWIEKIRSATRSDFTTYPTIISKMKAAKWNYKFSPAETSMMWRELCDRRVALGMKPFKGMADQYKMNSKTWRLERKS